MKLLLLLMLFQGRPVTPSVSGWKPAEACFFLSGLGMKTGTYKNMVLEEFSCLTPYREIGKAIFPNNIAYYVSGDAQTATSLKLVLNINDRGSAKAGHSEMLLFGKGLVRAATGGAMPPAMEVAITAGKPGKWTIGKSVVRLTRDDW